MKRIVEMPSQCSREILVEQTLWLIRLRWLAVACIVAATTAGRYVFPVLIATGPVYVCAGVLLACNVFYFWKANRRAESAGRRDVAFGFIQIEIDLLILTAAFHFSGGVANPFFLFYVFHIIIAAIILPQTLCYAVGLTAITMFGFLAVAKLNSWTWLGHYPLRFSIGAGLWKNPVYAFGAFVAFAFTVMLAQYLTRLIITRMMAKELEAARNNDLMNAVISAMAEGLVFVNCSGAIAICNPAAKLWKKNDCRDRRADEVDDFPDVLAEHIKMFSGAGDGGASSGHVVEFCNDAPVPRQFQTKSCRVTGIDGRELGFVVVGQDLTEHKNLEKELVDQSEKVAAINEMLKMSRVRMAQREKMVAIGQMAAGIAHEIGNPLASLSSVAQYLGRNAKSHEEKEQLLVIDYQVNRIAKILKRMLTLARPATAEYKWTDIGQLIGSTLSLVKYDKRMCSVAVEEVSESELPMVWLNPQAFEQVLLNVFINALDAMDGKDGDHEHVLTITKSFENGMVVIRVRDSGVGMSPEVCKRAFQSFFTTKEIGKGTGLGLFISYNLVAEIDGTIELDSELGKGSTVTIRIPVRPKKDLIDGSRKQDVTGGAEITIEQSVDNGRVQDNSS